MLRGAARTSAHSRNIKALRLSEPHAFDLSKLDKSEATRVAETGTRFNVSSPKSVQAGRGLLGSGGTENFEPKVIQKVSFITAGGGRLPFEEENGW